MILVSRCLLGEKCRYDGKDSKSQRVEKALRGKEYVAVCPEVAGGLTTPRLPVEIEGEHLIRIDGKDVTAEYAAGVQACLNLVDENKIAKAILKSRSPACGCGQIYDGTFSGRLKSGDGVFTRALKSRGIACRTEEDI